ncbi:uncharacterized protein LOC131235055 isoform X2 [Magnolia sinica]|nr:uncharacterized protein LOC131235055 isoform X2 [Magnolia sinica]
MEAKRTLPQISTKCPPFSGDFLFQNHRKPAETHFYKVPFSSFLPVYLEASTMAWEEEEESELEWEEKDIPFDFDFFDLLSQPKDYYRILEVDYDATEDTIRSNYIRLALKWHPDKRNDEDSATSRFQEINEAYKVLADPVKKREYDRSRILHAQDCSVIEYLHRFKGLILTCNGLGIRHSI